MLQNPLAASLRLAASLAALLLAGAGTSGGGGEEHAAVPGADAVAGIA